jgi:tripartite-type tricarboxylate transporter receptor subunit TctC
MTPHGSCFGNNKDEENEMPVTARPGLRPLLPVLAALVYSAAPPSAQSAEAYPTKPIRFLVGFAPAGANDLVARIVATHLGTRLGQQIVVENRPGAGGNVATQAVARAAPDGYTMLLGSVSSLGMSPALMKDIPFDPINDFAPITQLAGVSSLLSVHPSLPVRSVKELVALAKREPGRISVASPGVSSVAHLGLELFMYTAGVKFLHVPYKGGGPAAVDAIAGQVPAIISLSSTTIPHVQSGRLRGLAVTSDKRSPLLPNVPTVAESGYPGYEATGWLGALFPAKTPAPIVERMYREASAVLKTPAVRDQFVTAGVDPILSASPEAFHAYMKAELAKWSKLVKAANIKLE